MNACIRIDVGLAHASRSSVATLTAASPPLPQHGLCYWESTRALHLSSCQVFKEHPLQQHANSGGIAAMTRWVAQRQVRHTGESQSCTACSVRRMCMLQVLRSLWSNVCKARQWTAIVKQWPAEPMLGSASAPPPMPGRSRRQGRVLL